MGFQSKIVPEDILRVEDLTVRFGGFKALDNLNLVMERGELRVVIGPNGAGKTTLLDAMTGKVRPHSGRVLFQPRERSPVDITRFSEERIACLGIGRKFQTPNVFKTLTVLENLKLACKARRGVLGTLVAGFLPNGKDRVHEILETIGLTGKAQRISGFLAHG